MEVPHIPLSFEFAERVIAAVPKRNRITELHFDVHNARQVSIPPICQSGEGFVPSRDLVLGNPHHRHRYGVALGQGQGKAGESGAANGCGLTTRVGMRFHVSMASVHLLHAMNALVR